MRIGLSVVLVSAGLVLAQGCVEGKAPFDAEELSPLVGMDEKAETFAGKVTVVGTLTYGRSASASYTSTPKYRAYKFVGNTGDKVDIWVRSTTGDAMGWLTDASFRTLASNDDADARNTNSHLTATLPSGANATYYIVFREYASARATFTVALAGTANTTPTPPVASGATLIGDARPESARMVLVYKQDVPRRPTGLAFHPTRPSELWMVNYADDSVVTVYNPGRSNQRALRRVDPAASHFMHYPTTIAFGAGDTWATCGDGNNGGNQFMGPSLFSGDPNVFAVPTRGGLGSHLDMLHYSPYCMGMAHERGNAYWAFDNYHGALVRYDFARDHGPGADDHADGIIRVYVSGQMRGLRGIPSHLAYDARTAKLYAADTGNARIVVLDTRSGTLGAYVRDSLEPATPRLVNNATLSVLVPSGTLRRPSGLLLHRDLLYVTDHATSVIHAFDLSGRLVRSLRTGLSAGSLSGITAGPDGKAYFLDATSGSVYRVDVN